MDELIQSQCGQTHTTLFSKENYLMKLYLALEKELLIVEQDDNHWRTTSHLSGLPVTCVAADPRQPERIYCGTFGRGLWRSTDAGLSWQPIADTGGTMETYHDTGIPHAQITSLAISPNEPAEKYSVIYVGTEPTSLYRSENGGDTWQDLKSLRELPSAPDWHFPPRPFTSHARWITPDPQLPGHLFVAIEAGALVRSFDGGQTWEDRQPDGPLDTHTLLMHPLAPGRLYSAAGDGFGRPGMGYNESYDGGNTWRHPNEGLQHHYLWSAAVDAVDPDLILISASTSPKDAHQANENSISAIYRKLHGDAWQPITTGLPDIKGTVIANLTNHPNKAGEFYLLCNKGLYQSTDSGLTWTQLDIPWKSEYIYQHPQMIALSS